MGAKQTTQVYPNTYDDQIVSPASRVDKSMLFSDPEPNVAQFYAHLSAVSVPAVVINQHGILEHMNHHALSLFEIRKNAIIQGKQITSVLSHRTTMDLFDLIDHYITHGDMKLLLDSTINMQGKSIQSGKHVTGLMKMQPVHKYNPAAENTFFTIYIDEALTGIDSSDISDSVFFALAQLSPIPIIAIDTQGRILTFNKAAEYVFGHKAANVIRQKVNIIMPPEVAKHHDAYIQRYLKTGVKHVLDQVREVKAINSDGESIDIELRATEVMLTKNRKIFVAFARDKEKAMTFDDQQSALLASKLFPHDIAARLLAGEVPKDKHSNCTVMFLDFVGFSKLTKAISTKTLVEMLNHIYSAFDKITDDLKIEKIKSIGDSYECISGLPSNAENHAEVMIQACLKFVETIAATNAMKKYPPLHCRIGVHSGPVFGMYCLFWCISFVANIMLFIFFYSCCRWFYSYYLWYLWWDCQFCKGNWAVVHG